MAIGSPEHPLSQAFALAEDRYVPLSALVELTNACNVDCEHCYLDLIPDSKIGALATEDWRRIFRELKAEGCLFLTLSGGELLVRKDWYELATYARRLGFALRLYTNGTLIDDRAADRIRDLKPLGVEISLLGGIALTHDAVVRRRGAFEKTLAGIRRLRERKVPVLLKCVVMRRNAHEVDTLRELGQRLGCEVYFDLEISPKNNGSIEPTTLAPEEDVFVQAARNVLGDEPDGGYLDGIPRAERLASAPCGAGRRTCHVGPTGDVHACTQWTRSLGNLRHTSFHDVWHHSTDLALIRRTRIQDFPVCASCELLNVCAPCMALSLLEQGTIDGPSPTKCRSAELRAQALGRPGRSAWLAQQSHLGEVSVPAGASSVLVGLRRKDGRALSVSS